MRLFDVVGGAVLVSWIALVATFTYKVNVLDVAPEVEASDTIVITPGSSWMILSREGKEIGYVHEVRTGLDEGWLFEYEMMMAISIAGQDRLIDTNMKATLDHDARLQSFQGSVDSLLGTFALKGDVTPLDEGARVDLVIDLGGEPSERAIPLPELPRLSSNALNQLIAQPDLEPGTVYEQEFFDPMSMGSNKLVYEFVERKMVDVYDEKVDALHFRQKVMGNELDVFVTPEGEIVIQEFPMRTLGVRMPAILAKSRVNNLRAELLRGRKNARAKGADVPDQVGKVAGILERANSGEVRGVKGALQLLGDVLDVGTEASASSYWRVEGLSADAPLDLESPRQRILANGATARSLTVALDPAGETGLRAWSPAPLSDADRAALLAVSPEPAPPEDAPPEDAPDEAPDEAPEDGEERPASGWVLAILADAREAAGGTLSPAAAVDALRRAGVPARFASGARQVGGAGEVSRLYSWIQFHDGARFVDADPAAPDFALGADTLQLRVSAQSVEAASAAGVLKDLKIRRISTEPAAGAPEKTPDDHADEEGGDDAPGE
jgi:hypothetical protein